MAAVIRAYVLPLFLFNDSCQTSYLKIYRTECHQACRVGRTMPVDDQSEISFSISQKKRCRCSQFCRIIDRTKFLGFGDIRQMAVTCVEVVLVVAWRRLN